MFQETPQVAEKPRLFDLPHINVERAVHLAYYFAPLSPGSRQRKYGGRLGDVENLVNLLSQHSLQSNFILDLNDQSRTAEIRDEFLKKLGINQEILTDFNDLVEKIAHQDPTLDPAQAWQDFFDKHKPASSPLEPTEPKELINYIEKLTGLKMDSSQPEIAKAA